MVSIIGRYRSSIKQTVEKKEDLTNDVHGEGDEPVMPDKEGEEVAPIDHHAKLFNKRLAIEEIV